MCLQLLTNISSAHIISRNFQNYIMRICCFRGEVNAKCFCAFSVFCSSRLHDMCEDLVQFFYRLRKVVKRPPPRCPMIRQTSRRVIVLSVSVSAGRSAGKRRAGDIGRPTVAHDRSDGRLRSTISLEQLFRRSPRGLTSVYWRPCTPSHPTDPD